LASGLPEPVRLFEEVGLHGPEQHDGLARMPVKNCIIYLKHIKDNKIFIQYCTMD
jgi:hypothetical protein